MKKYCGIVCFLTVLCSCSITQRKYSPWYTIEWAGTNKVTPTGVTKISSPSINSNTSNIIKPIRVEHDTKHVIANTQNLKNNSKQSPETKLLMYVV